MSGPVGIAGDQLRAIVERIEHVEDEIPDLATGGPGGRDGPILLQKSKN